MLKIDICNSDIQNIIKVYQFTSFMANKNITVGKISVFEDLIIDKLSLNKNNLHF